MHFRMKLVALICYRCPSRYEIDEYSCHHQRRYEAPAYSPVNAYFLAQHKLHVETKPIQAVNPNDRQQLGNGEEEGNERRSIKVQKYDEKLSSWCSVETAETDADYRDDEHDFPASDSGKAISNHCHYCASHADVTSNTERK